MKAVVLENYGGTEELQIREIPNPLPGSEELLVKVHATALNRADILQRKGLYPGPPSEHEIPGLEFSGIVQALGSDVMNYAIGDRVMGIVASGGICRTPNNSPSASYAHSGKPILRRRSGNTRSMVNCL